MDVNTKIQKCIDNNETTLDLEGLNIDHLSFIPDHVTILHVNMNNLKELPPLPKNLKELYCSRNYLKQLPDLPETLEILRCKRNLLTSLPKLPSTLLKLLCQRNELTRLPDLPDSLLELECDDNQIIELPTLPPKLELLNVWTNKLTTLPKLPSTLKSIDLSYNLIKPGECILPEGLKDLTIYGGEHNLLEDMKLPDSLEYLFVTREHIMTDLKDGKAKIIARPIIKLPNKLPKNLKVLNCIDCGLTNLPVLPDGLTGLQCYNNDLVRLPILPASLTDLLCYNNPYLHVPKEIDERFNNQYVKQSPNYWAIMQRIKSIKKSRERKKKLQFCVGLQDVIDELRYRPGGGGYWELKEKNKNVFL